MATTDARTGFRLPWSSDRPTDAADESTAEAVAADSGWSSDGTAIADAPADAATAPEAGSAEAEDAPSPEAVADEPPAVEAESPDTATPAKAAGKKPNKFLADLTKAMQAAAEEARGRSLTQLQADAKNHVESIHARSATEAADLRRVADDDVAAIREWSKAEIARIREETDQKITDRKGRLEREVEDHAGVIEREIEAVQATVARFEAEMATFFERLLGEDDPTRFATMAENLPEPPTFDHLFAAAIVDAPAAPPKAAVEVEERVAEVEEPVVEAVAETESDESTATVETATAETTEEPATEAVDASDTAEALIGETATDASPDESDSDTTIGTADLGELDGEFDSEVDREAAFAAIQAAAEAAASAEVAADAAARAEAVADVAIEIIGNHDGDAEGESEADPRVAALGLSPDYDAAEAEALAAADTSDGEEIPTIGDDALAARLAGLVPNNGASAEAGDAVSTQVIVVGLVSVASIASFKRHLGRVSGVRSVGVSSGPDGEFVFAVTHAAETNLRDAVPSLPSFQARVTSTSDGVVNVTAHDPEADA